MFNIYIVVSAVVTLLLEIPFELFRQEYSWWLVPAVLAGVEAALVVIHLIILAISVLCVNLKKPPKDTKFFRFLVKGFLQMALPFLGVSVKTSGMEKVPQDEPFLLVCNHIHDLDPAVIYYALPDSNLAFVAKKEIKELFPFVYRALYKLNGLPIDRENNREAAKTIINATKLIKEKTHSVAVFPEGYVSKSGELLPIRNGALKIATKSQVKIVVCTLWGTKEIPKNLFKRKTEIHFNVLEVLDTQDNIHTAELGETVHNIMEESVNSFRKN